MGLCLRIKIVSETVMICVINCLSYQYYNIRLMGSTLCSSYSEHTTPNIFSYTYGQDNKEIKINHNDTIECSLESIRPSLVDCEAKLKRSEKRFKDVSMETEPILLACGEKELHCTFERPEVFLKPEASLSNKIYRILDASNCSPNNVIVGDEVLQYFGVFLCYLSANPELIDRIILTHRNSYGVHALQVIFDHRREVLFIDDYILCHGKKPLFSQPVKFTGMWTCLLQKAWFKIKSCLKSKINAVHPIEVFNTFLSYPIRRYQLTDSFQKNRKIIGQYIINGQLHERGFGCIITSKVRPSHKIGLTGSKHFYFLRTLQVDGKFYFYLRNPCGNFDFRGSLHQLPAHLEKEIRRLTGEDVVPGNFLLTEDEFDEQIDSFFIVNYNPISSISSEQEIFFPNSFNGECYVKFQITKKGEVGLRLQQLSPTHQYSPFTYLLLDVTRNVIISGQNNDQGCFGVAQTNLLNAAYQGFQPGTYILRMKKKSPNKQLKNKTRDRLIMSCNENVKFQISDAGELKNEFMFSVKEICKKQLAKDKQADRDEIEHKIMWMGDVVVIYVNKLNTGKEVINLQVLFSEQTNLECLTHQIGKVYTSLPPFQKDMLIVFQKIVLTEETKLGKYKLTPY